MTQGLTMGAGHNVRPLCPCHGEPMEANGFQSRNGRRRWGCVHARKYHEFKKRLRRRIRATEARIAELERQLASQV